MSKEKFTVEIDWDYVFNFGKHSGESISEVLETDPSYIIWLHENTDHVIDEQIYLKAEENAFLFSNYQ